MYVYVCVETQGLTAHHLVESVVQVTALLSCILCHKLCVSSHSLQVARVHLLTPCGDKTGERFEGEGRADQPSDGGSREGVGVA